MALIEDKHYYVASPSVVLREAPDAKSEPKNHLLFGDWLAYKGPTQNGFARIFCRGNVGWIPLSSIREDRILEINFLDIGIGDGCHIVTPDDEIMLIDAGKTDNMERFLSWRYNLRNRKVKGVDGIADTDPKGRSPMEIDHVVMSHPDKDHYYGFLNVFKNKKLSVKNIYHSGIVERPIKAADKDPSLHYYSGDDLGGYLKFNRSTAYIWEMIRSNTAMHNIIAKFPKTTKQYMTTLREAVKNSPNVKFHTLSYKTGFLDGFSAQDKMAIEVMGPVTESIKKGTETKECLKRLGAEGVTKNGHSIVFKLKIGKLLVFLGGDLNTESEDYLIQHYCETDKAVSKIEKEVSKLIAKGSAITHSESQDLAEYQTELQAIIAKARKVFQADVVKACHHGSHHFSETFLKCLNAIVTVVSSGDGDSYAHPRPDALGSFGKYGRGERPLIFSTEIGRSTKEFSNIYDYYEQLKAYEAAIDVAPTAAIKKDIREEMEGKKDRNVVVYGMITLRTDGEQVILAQKLEQPAGDDQKWDIHELKYNANNLQFEYVKKTGH
ncbi:ComEC/Rec2 family competence protein [Winogradskyella sp. PE311]|uniref:ComEC/Rec2 family competence protein n=1 Tax=Winogradskyella sp. PE311 TaxID=3366943 RepID=UPI003980AFF9